MSSDPVGFAIAHLRAEAEVKGYTALKVDDGEIVVFSRKGLTDLLARMDEKGDETALIFIKHGAVLLPEEGN